MGMAVTAAMVGLLAIVPAPLLPVARAFRDLCRDHPVLAVLTGHLPPLPVSLLITLLGLAFANAIRAGGIRLAGTLRFNRRLVLCARPVPSRLAEIGDYLKLTDRLVFLDVPELTAFCFGFRHPFVAVTAGLMAQLDDEELLAVLAHEQHHLVRRDPARYLMLHMLSAAGFMFPVTPALRRRLETRAELAADRAALAMVHRGALAGALLTVLTKPETVAPGAAGLSATDVRIAHLVGKPAVLAIPMPAVITSFMLIAFIAAIVGLSASSHLVAMVCRLCTEVG